MASGINNTFRQLGIATGIAALGAIFRAGHEGVRAPGLRTCTGSRRGSRHERIAAAPPSARADRQVARAGSTTS